MNSEKSSRGLKPNYPASGLGATLFRPLAMFRGIRSAATLTRSALDNCSPTAHVAYIPRLKHVGFTLNFVKDEKGSRGSGGD